MSSQFIHQEAFARSPKVWSGTDKKGKSKGGQNRSIQEIIDELNRKAGACPHVPEPLPPVHLYGVDASKIPEMCEEYAATMKDAAGKKLAKSALVCIAGVVSVGEPDREKWESVKADSLAFLKEKFGDRLKSVVEHKDEAFPHFHYYVIPRPGEKLEDIHEGLKARNESRRLKEPTGTQNRKYRDAMKGFQDAYSIKVSAKNGLTRIGPARRRLSRDGWRAEQAAAQDLSVRLEHYSNKELIAKAAYKKGHSRGFAKGMEQGLASVSKFGEKVGTFFKSILGPLHKPTAVVAKELEQAKLEIQKENEARVKAEKEVIEEQKASDRRAKEIFENAKADRLAPNASLQEELNKTKEKLKTVVAESAQKDVDLVVLSEKNNDLHKEIKALKDVVPK